MLVSEVPALREYSYPVARAAEVGAEPRRVELFGEGYVVWRPSPGAPAEAATDECPHRGARLSQGWVEDGCVVCPYHGWRFAAGGGCTLIPQNDPALPIPPRARLLPVLCEERYGYVWLCVGMPRAGLPDLPEATSEAAADGWSVRHEFLEVWDASAPRVVDNSLDISHVAFVHKGTIGDPDNPTLPPFTVERHAHGLSFDLSYLSVADARQQANLGLSPGDPGTTTGPDGSMLVRRDVHVDLCQPLVFRGVLTYPNGVSQVLMKGASPIDDHRSLFWQFVARNDAPDDERWQGIVATDRAVTNEDRPILEGVTSDFPLDVTTEIHTRSDRMTVEYRRLLATLASESPTPPRPDATWARQTASGA